MDTIGEMSHSGRYSKASFASGNWYLILAGFDFDTDAVS